MLRVLLIITVILLVVGIGVTASHIITTVSEANTEDSPPQLSTTYGRVAVTIINSTNRTDNET